MPQPKELTYIISVADQFNQHLKHYNQPHIDCGLCPKISDHKIIIKQMRELLKKAPYNQNLIDAAKLLGVKVIK